MKNAFCLCSGALVQCQKVGAANWGKKKKEEKEEKSIKRLQEFFAKSKAEERAALSSVKKSEVGIILLRKESGLHGWFQGEAENKRKAEKLKAVGLLVEPVMIKVGQTLWQD